MANRIVLFFFLLCSSSTLSLAQFSLPRIDVEVKAHQTLIPGDDYNSPTSLKAIATTNLLLATHVQINQYLAVGWYYSNSFRGSGYNTDFKGKFWKDGDSKAMTSLSGPDIRISTGRAAKWRPYLSINYASAQVVEDKGSFRFSTKLAAVGGSIGIMRRYGNHLYWNVLEIGIKQFSQKLFWGNDSFLIDAKMGFTYNIGKKK
ncbi:MAG: hypothetical protein HYR67_05480 [Bacteroidetes bacterium]|nr:hypothetical protein [Bacteroidota bacterium]